MEAGELSRIEKELIQNWKGTPTEIIHDRRRPANQTGISRTSKILAFLAKSYNGS